MRRSALLTLAIALFIGTAVSANAAPTLTPAEILDIIYATGHRMRAAGFDRAGNLRTGLRMGYHYEVDTIEVENLNNTSREYMQFLQDIPLADLYATIAAHEHCHAYLWKHVDRYPPAVSRAIDRCGVFPESGFKRFFDEVFCDLAAVNVVGKSSAVSIERFRQHDDREIESSIERYLGHSYPLFRLALVANDPREPNLVTRTAKAVASACMAPEVQALVGVKEREFSKTLTANFAEYVAVPKARIAPVAPITLPTVREWRGSEGRPFERIRVKTGDGPPMLFVHAYRACKTQFATHGRPEFPGAARAMQRCKLDQQAFDDAHCVMLSGDIAKATDGGLEDYRAVTDLVFGRESLASQIIQDNEDYYRYAGTASLGEPDSVALRVELACGANPEELAELFSIRGAGKQR